MEHGVYPRNTNYVVYADGRVWSVERIDPNGHRAGGRFLSLMTQKPGGYHRVRLSPGNRATFVHHLVLETFRGPKPPGCRARHLNGDPADNRLDNLAWGTEKEIERDRVLRGARPRGERVGSAKLCEREVMEIKARYATGLESQAALGAEFGVSQRAVGYIVTGKNWKYAGIGGSRGGSAGGLQEQTGKAERIAG